MEIDATINRHIAGLTGIKYANIEKKLEALFYFIMTASLGSCGLDGHAVIAHSSHEVMPLNRHFERIQAWLHNHVNNVPRKYFRPETSDNDVKNGALYWRLSIAGGPIAETPGAT